MALRVLTVDDSKTIRIIIKKALDPYDCQVFEAENGIEGLAAAIREKPDLMILDITMPEMNGIEMLEKVQGIPTLKSIPVIMLTAESGKDNVVKIVKMGIKNYMIKPFKGDQLIERVQSIVKLEPKKEEKAKPDDGAKKYFLTDGDVERLVLPPKVDRPIAVEVEGTLKNRIKEMLPAGLRKLVLDLHKVTETNVTLIRLITLTLQDCQTSNIAMRVVGTTSLSNELKAFKETGEIPVYASFEEAKASL
jgi:CheY-like chemotaxis protein